MLALFVLLFADQTLLPIQNKTRGRIRWPDAQQGTKRFLEQRFNCIPKQRSIRSQNTCHTIRK